MGKKKKQVGETSEENGNHSNDGDKSPNAYDNDTLLFIATAQELKEEGNKMFQKRDLRGAMVRYEKALKLLPRDHIDVSYVRSNMAACYMQMGLGEYPRAINECNLALEVTPKYGKALLKRARCYEALNRLDLALRDVSTVLKMEPNNIMALEISDKVKSALEDRGLRVNDEKIELPPDYVEPSFDVPSEKAVKEKKHKKKSKKEKVKASDEIVEKQAEEKLEEKKEEDSTAPIKAEDDHLKEKKRNKSKKKAAKEKIDKQKEDVKEVNEEKSNGRSIDVPKKTAKLVFGDDIRWAQLPVNCSLFQLREVICDRFPSLGAVLVKYRDQEGDLITITSDEELKWAETGSQGSIRLYIVEANPNHDPFYEKLHLNDVEKVEMDNAPKNGCVVKSKEIVSSSCVEDWIIHFAELFKNHVGFESDRYLDFHELGMKLYSEAVEETVTSEEAQGLFDMAGGKFQEMTALALFNWGNVHMSRARKKVYLTEEDSSKEHMYEQIKSSYEWAQKEYAKAGEKFEAAIKIKSDFYEGFLALGQQRFEQAKLSWYYALSSNIDLPTWPSTEVLHLYNNAEENMEKGMLIWEESQEQQLSETSTTGLDGLFENMSSDETAELAANMRSQINLLWGTMLYERSLVEFKLGLPVWHESLEAAIEKFEHAGASPTDVAVMLKNHCSNNTAVDGLGFKIDEIVQAWNEMYEAKKLQKGVSSFRLEPLFRRRVSKIYHAFELV